MPKKPKAFNVLFFWQNPVKVKIHTPKNQTILHALPAASTAGPYPTIIAVITVICGSTIMCRRNGNCEDPNQSDSYVAG